jgi:V8-like Glu-specific endopeptidase
MSGRRALVGCVLVSVGVVGACAQDRGTVRSRQAIIDGSPAPNRTGVVYLAHPESDEVCSGTVVAPTLVLTAQHCTFDRKEDPMGAAVIVARFVTPKQSGTSASPA